MESIERHRTDILRKNERIRAVEASVSSCMSAFKEISQMLIEVNSRKPEIEAMGTLLVNVDDLKMRQNRCFDLLNQDRMVLQQVGVNDLEVTK